MIKRALISVFDKNGILDFSKFLIENGVEIISTGGTYKHLRENGVTVTEINEVTNFPEMLDGRVKTLHPLVHAGILAIRDNKEHMKTLEEREINTIEYVVVNLYPLFERRVRLLVQDCLDDSVWNLRKEKEDFSTAFFTDAFLGFYINYIRDHEEIDYNMLQIGLEFLFDKFLSTVRITKEESGEQK